MCESRDGVSKSFRNIRMSMLPNIVRLDCLPLSSSVHDWADVLELLNGALHATAPPSVVSFSPLLNKIIYRRGKQAAALAPLTTVASGC